jgi:hypothetical protein
VLHLIDGIGQIQGATTSATTYELSKTPITYDIPHREGVQQAANSACVGERSGLDMTHGSVSKARMRNHSKSLNRVFMWFYIQLVPKGSGSIWIRKVWFHLDTMEPDASMRCPARYLQYYGYLYVQYCPFCKYCTYHSMCNMLFPKYPKVSRYPCVARFPNETKHSPKVRIDLARAGNDEKKVAAIRARMECRVRRLMFNISRLRVLGSRRGIGLVHA